VRLCALPEYEPPARPAPPDPHDLPDPPQRWAPITLVRPPPGDCPVWNEPGQVRDLLWRLVSLVLEALDGRRPVDHLHGLVSERLYHSVRTRSRACLTAGRAHRLRTLHTCRPADGVIEVCGVVAVTSARARRPAMIAVAGRVERRGDRWRCTALRPLYSAS
jgi:Family of unknown function (DUF6459)